MHFVGSGSHTLGRYQTCKYICKGTGEDEFFEPRFSYNGYRFIEVAGLGYEPNPADVEIRVIGSKFEPIGSFTCSDNRLNHLQQVLLRTLRNYYMHLPCDPTREKAGWTQDVETVFHPSAYNLLVGPNYIKWQRDFLDTIHPSGYVPPVVPSRFDGPTINGPWWGGAIVYGPWQLYQFYGDTGILAESYPAMQKQVEYLDSIAKDGIVEWGLGDWMEVGSVRPLRTPVPFTSTCALAWFCDILRQTAHVLNKPDDVVKWTDKASAARSAMNRKFLNTATGDYATSSQASQLLPLVLNLAPKVQRPQVFNRLVQRIEADNFHLSTGFVSTPWLLTGLSDMGRGDLAWRIATQDDYPGWIDAIIKQGNTVMKEDWKGGLVQMPTLQGPIGTWFYHSLAGIRLDPHHPGFSHFTLWPDTHNSLTWIRAHFDSLHGRIESNWKRNGDRFEWEFTIPPNTSATVKLDAPPESIQFNGTPLQAESIVPSSSGVAFHAPAGQHHLATNALGRRSGIVRKP